MTYPKFKNKHLEEALFDPKDFLNYVKYHNKNLPKRYIIIYAEDILKYLKKKYRLKKINTAQFTKSYSYDNIGIIKIEGIGSPLAASVFEELIAMGGKFFINIGAAGGLQKEGIYLCKKALRDEGTSYHYIAKGKFEYPDKELTNKLSCFLKKHNIEFKEGVNWTIDAPYRETISEINKYKKQGYSTVEMEASALFAVAKFRRVKIASAFVVSDILGKKWEPKFFHMNTKKLKFQLIDAAIDCLRNIK